LLLVAAFLGGTIISGLVLSQVLQRRAEAEVVDQSRLLAGFADAIRSYTSDELSPLLLPAVAQRQGFVMETLPTFATKQVFGLVRRNSTLEDFQYRAATLNPSNREDLPDAEEAALVARFRADAALHEVSGYRTLGNQTVFYSARPLVVGNETCLTCHSDPSVAPPGMVAQYGDQGGFGWQLHEIVGTQIIYVPASEVLDATRRSLLLVLGVFILSFIFATVLINLLLRRSVVWPLRRMSGLAAQISRGEMGTEGAASQIASLDGVATRADELGQSARVFQQMAREVWAREQALLARVEELRIEIDTVKKERAVREITDSDFFRDLQDKARSLRRTPAVPPEGRPGE
jgi:HAMP domain-containing protein